MALSGSRLAGNLKSDILSQLQTQFPVSGSLQSAEQTGMAAAQTKLANAVGDGSGTDIVTEVKLGTVTTTGVTSGGATAPGTIA